MISVRDNGTGIAHGDFVRTMSSIADSTKDRAEDKGFRGIGRLGGISSCKTLKFSCSVRGEETISICAWDAQLVRDILVDGQRNPSAGELVDMVTSYSQDVCDVDDHFFLVELIDVENSSAELLDEKRVREYLQSVAPIPYATGFTFKSKISEFAQEHGFIIDEYQVFVNGDQVQSVYDLLRDNYLLEDYTATKKAILDTYEKLRPYFETVYSQKPKQRHVDFNQGIDARLITDANMEKLAEIPIRPVRIAFDHWELHEVYEKAVRTAVRHGHTNLSNYILYNYEDQPIELYLRLKLNVDLCEKLGASIYSFPMKYHPIEDPEYFDNRDFIGKHWNRKFIRTIQAILNSTKGKVGRGHDFFCKAFGANEQEYFKLLYMPEAMIIYRFFFEGIGLTDEWWAAFSGLTDDEMEIAKPIIEKNIFTDIQGKTDNNNVLNVLRYYCITRDDAERMMENH